MPKETFADRLKDALNRQGMKQVDVIRAASQAGVKLGKSHMSQYVSGKTIPREEILRFLAKTLQVTPEWLAGGESEPERLAGAGNEPEEQAAGRSERKRQTAGSEAERQTGAGSTASARQPESAAVPRAGAAAGSDSDKENSGGRKMREFKKSSKLNNVLYDVRGPVVDEAERMEEAGTQILKLNIGNPAPFGFRTPDEVIYDMRQQLTECEGYHAVCPGKRPAECFHREHLYGKRRQRTD